MDSLSQHDPLQLLICAVLVIVVGITLVHLVPYLTDPYDIRSFQGPLLGKLSPAWYGWTVAQGDRSRVVHELHQKYGKFVRLAPDHISIASVDALHPIYGYGTGTRKSDFYNAFVTFDHGVFSATDRNTHARKRRMIAHSFGQRQIVSDYEPIIRSHLAKLVRQWDRMCDGGLRDERGEEGEGGWYGKEGRTWLDCLGWYNYLVFDFTSDLVFGEAFGMLNVGRGTAWIAKDEAYGETTTADSPLKSQVEDLVEVPAVRYAQARGMFAGTIGALPESWRPIAKKVLHFYRTNNYGVKIYNRLAVAAVAKRLATPTDRRDLLAELLVAKDDNGKPIGHRELTTEALGLLIAGSDTTSNSTCAITYFLANYPEVQEKLRAELQHALDPDEHVAHYDQVKNLRYLHAIIYEALRVHAPLAMGLPRIVPPGGLTILGRYFKAGTILSCPTYTIHRDEKVFGDDVEAFRPERWLMSDDLKDPEQSVMLRSWNVFSYGPRACIGRNLALMNLAIIISTLIRRYEIVPLRRGAPLEVVEAFLRRPLMLWIGIKRRKD